MKKLSESQVNKFLHLSMLSMSIDDKSIFPELLFLLDSKTFLKLVSVYGGSSIKIPSKLDLKKASLTMVYYYHVIMLGENPEDVCVAYKIKGHILRSVRLTIKKFESIDNKKVHHSFKKINFHELEKVYNPRVKKRFKKSN